MNFRNHVCWALTFLPRHLISLSKLQSSCQNCNLVQGSYMHLIVHWPWGSKPEFLAFAICDAGLLRSVSCCLGSHFEALDTESDQLESDLSWCSSDVQPLSMSCWVLQTICFIDSLLPFGLRIAFEFAVNGGYRSLLPRGMHLWKSLATWLAGDVQGPCDGFVSRVWPYLWRSNCAFSLPITVNRWIRFLTVF